MWRASRTIDSLSPLDRVIPYTNERGLRDYRASAIGRVLPWPRWPWLLVLGFLLGFVLGEAR